MTGQELLRKLAYRGCRVRRRTALFAVLTHGGRRTLVPLHAGHLPAAIVERIVADLKIDIRRRAPRRRTGS